MSKKSASGKDEVHEYLSEQSDEELLTLLGAITSDPRYERNSYTEMVESIADKFEEYQQLTDRQRAAVCVHLSFNKKLWF